MYLVELPTPLSSELVCSQALVFVFARVVYLDDKKAFEHAVWFSSWNLSVVICRFMKRLNFLFSKSSVQ